MCIKKLAIFKILILVLLLVFPQTVYANPAFYLTGETIISGTDAVTFELHLNTDGSQIGALQGVINYDSNYFSTPQVSYFHNSKLTICNIWAPANSVPPGENFSRQTPYIYNSKAIFSCGITGTSGYLGSDGYIGKLTLTPIDDGNTELTLSDAYFAFIDSPIAPGAMSDLTLVLYGTEPTPTPESTPTPTATTSATPTPIVTSETIFDDVEIVEFENNTSGSSTGATTTGSGNSDLEVIEENNAIPAPPPMTPRPNATPFPAPNIYYQEGQPVEGEVLSVQNLRDLIIPGKSQADKTVVMVNFISTITFLILIAIVLWKMFMNTRGNKLKTQYIQEMISGELSALESKMAIVGEKAGQEKFKTDFSQATQHIMTGMDPKKDKKNEPEKPKT